MKSIDNYTPEELQFYLHQQELLKSRNKASRNTDAKVTKRQERDQRRLDKIQKKETTEKKVAYWKSTTPQYRRYVNNALRRGYTFSLTMEQFTSIVQAGCCVFCGPTDGDEVGVDRIDSTKGYDIHNCQPCCTVCNIMKRNMTDELFLLHIVKIAMNHRKD